MSSNFEKSTGNGPDNEATNSVYLLPLSIQLLYLSSWLCSFAISHKNVHDMTACHMQKEEKGGLCLLCTELASSCPPTPHKEGENELCVHMV